MKTRIDENVQIRFDHLHPSIWYAAIGAGEENFCEACGEVNEKEVLVAVISTDPRFRRKGYATKLIKSIERHFGKPVRPKSVLPYESATEFWSSIVGREYVEELIAKAKRKIEKGAFAAIIRGIIEVGDPGHYYHDKPDDINPEPGLFERLEKMKEEGLVAEDTCTGKHYATDLGMQLYMSGNLGRISKSQWWQLFQDEYEKAFEAFESTLASSLAF